MTDILATDTIETYAERWTTEANAKAELARKEAFRKATSNTARLLIMGVLTTCDDEFDRSCREAGIGELATARGISFDEMEAILVRDSQLNRARERLESTVRLGRTSEEWGALVASMKAAMPKGVKDNGTGCTHKNAWHHCNATSMWCRRCGASMNLENLWIFETPTQNAVNAAIVLENSEPVEWDYAGLSVMARTTAEAKQKVLEYLRSFAPDTDIPDDSVVEYRIRRPYR